MTVLIDTNVILDVLLRREQFLEKSASIMLLSEKKIIDGYVSASAVTGGEIYRAIDLNWSDFEDAVQYTTGEHIQADYIITRDTRG